MRAALVLLSLSWLVGGCRDETLPPGPPPPAFQEGIELATSDLLLDQGVVASRFNFAQTTDLWVRVKVADLPHQSALTLSFVEPNGQIFFETRLWFSPDATEAHMTDVPGEPMNPTTVFAVKRVGQGFALDHPIAIDGTTFTRYPLPGTWQVRALLASSNRTLTAEMDVLSEP